MQRDTIFVSYSRADSSGRDALVKHLEVVLGKPPRVRIFADTSIETGEEWRNRIRDEMDRALVVVLLVSADFLTSEFVQSVEIPRAALAARRGEAVIACLYVRHCAAEDFRIHVDDPNGEGFDIRVTDYQGLNDPNSPLMALKGAKRERLLAQAAGKIVGLAEARVATEAKHKAEEERRQREAEAKRKAEEERRQREAEAKLKAEEERRQQEAEAKLKAEEERRQREAEAKHKAEEERRQREAEAKRKAAEERKQKEAEAKHKAEEERRQREAEAKRKVEEERRQREAEAKHKAEEERRQQEAEAQGRGGEKATRSRSEAQARIARRLRRLAAVLIAICIVVCLAGAGLLLFSRGPSGGLESIRESEMMWVKCNNVACNAEYEMSARKYYEELQANVNANPMALGPVAVTCEKCGKLSLYAAIKCANVDCGEVFIKGTSGANDFADRCPKCGKSETEEIRRKRLSGG